MNFPNQESIKVLEFALSKEKEAIETYEKISSKTKNQGVTEVINILINEEKKHFSIISELIKEAKDEKTKSKIIMSASLSPEEILTKNLLKKDIVSHLKEDFTIIELLIKAREKEKDSFELYSNAKMKTKDEHIASIYEYLACEENRHHILIDNLLDYLDVLDKWIYKEENLIYRL